MIPYSPKELRREMNISTRTYFRYLDILGTRKRFPEITHRKNWNLATYMTVKAELLQLCKPGI